MVKPIVEIIIYQINFNSNNQKNSVRFSQYKIKRLSKKKNSHSEDMDGR